MGDHSLHDGLVFFSCAFVCGARGKFWKVGAHENKGIATVTIKNEHSLRIRAKVLRFIRRHERPGSNKLILERYLLTVCAAGQQGKCQGGDCRMAKKITSIHSVPPLNRMKGTLGPSGCRSPICC